MKLSSILGIRGARDKPQDSYGGSAYSFFFGRSTSGKNVNERTAMQTTAVYSCAYAQIIRDGYGRVLGLYPLLPDKMEVDRDENGLGFDGLVGYSPIAMSKNAVGMTMACEEYGASFFENGATPGGVLEYPGVLKDPSKVRESWHSVYGGSRNSGKVAVLEEGMKYQQIGIPPEEAQFLETRKFQINEIARLYRRAEMFIEGYKASLIKDTSYKGLWKVSFTLKEF